MLVAKCLVAFVAVFGFGGVLADAVIPATARQHLFNPAWKPHAKFHNAQSMLMGCFNGTLALVLLFFCDTWGMKGFLTATAAAGIYWFALLLSPLFPGTAWFDPEFEAITPRPIGLHAQQLVALILCFLLAVAVAMASLSALGTPVA